MTTIPLTAIRNPDGQMYLKDENPFKNDEDPFDANGRSYDLTLININYNDFEATHPPIIALFKCEEGQQFFEGVDVEKVWQWKHPNRPEWHSIKDDKELHWFQKVKQWKTRQIYTTMESYTKKMNYYDQIEIGKGAFKDDNLFDFFCTVLMDVISDNGLTRFDIKDLVSAINEEIEKIQVENIRERIRFI